MNTTQNFEERLLCELRQIVAENPAAAIAAPAPRRGALPRFALAGGGLVAATATAVVVLAGGDRTTPAFAVEPHSDGSVTVEISSLRDAAGLQSKLRAAGIPAVVDYTPPGKSCKQPRFTPAGPGGGPMHGSVSGGSTNGGSTTFTISPGEVGANESLVIETSVGEGVSSVGVAVAKNPVAPCVLVDAPTLPAPPPGAVTSERGMSTQGAHEAPGKGTAKAPTQTATG